MSQPIDFSHGMPNPHFNKLSREVNFRLDFDSIAYFQQLGEPYGLTAEQMMYRYLRYMAGMEYKADLGLLTPAERERLAESLGKHSQAAADA